MADSVTNKRKSPTKLAATVEVCQDKQHLPFLGLTVFRRLFASQLRRNMFSGVATTVINSVVMLITYPVYLHYLGYEKLGVWLVLTTVLTFVQMCNLGMGSAVTKLVAEEYGLGNTQGIQSYVTTALWTLAATGCIVIATVILLANPIISFFKLGPEDAALAKHFLPYMAMLTVYAFLVQILTATLSGLGRMDQTNYRDSACRVISLGVTVVLLIFGYGLFGLLVGTAINYLLIHITSVFLIRKIVRLQILQLNWDLKRFRKLLSFGGAVLGSSLIGMLFGPFNKLMLSRYAGVSTIPIYEIAFTGSMQIRSLLDASLRALMPEVSRIGANVTSQIKHRISQLNMRAMKIIFLFGVPLYTGLIIFAPFMLKLWLGDRFVETLPGAFRIMLVGTFLSLLGVPAYYVLLGMGRVRHTLVAHIILSGVSALIVATNVFFWHRISVQTITLAILTSTLISTLYLNWQLRILRGQARSSGTLIDLPPMQAENV